MVQIMIIALVLNPSKIPQKEKMIASLWLHYIIVFTLINHRLNNQLAITSST